MSAVERRAARTTRPKPRARRPGPPHPAERRDGSAALSPGRDGGERLLAAAQHAAARLAAHVDEVDALNVFPVPDGDTGTNMLATMRAAVEEARRIPRSERTLGSVAGALSFASLMGARGNSGVILSQILRGMAAVVGDRSSIDGDVLAQAIRQGSRAAYDAIGQPIEGTMLTVIRETADAATAAAAAGRDLLGVLHASVAAAEASVARTPDLLPILREAGVVDSGGYGLALLLGGALRSLIPDAHVEEPVVAAARPSLAVLAAHADDGFGYETVFLVTTDRGALVLDDVRRRLETMGGSVVVAGDSRMLKVHIHNDRPDLVLGYGLSLGSLQQVSVQNLDSGARQMLDARTHDALDLDPVGHAMSGVAVASVPPVSRPVVVAVATGEGFVRLLEAGGASVVPARGRRSSPGELYRAILATEASEVVVLPNDRNVQLAAEQAAALLDGIRVVVVPTRNMAEGVGALLALDGHRTAADNGETMLRAARAVRTLAVAEAARDAPCGDRTVRTGQTIVLDPDEGLVAAGDDRVATTLDAVAAMAPGHELLTIYRGEGAGSEEAAVLAARLRDAFPGVEVELVDGGQPHYCYLIAAE